MKGWMSAYHGYPETQSSRTSRPLDKNWAKHHRLQIYKETTQLLLPSAQDCEENGAYDMEYERYWALIKLDSSTLSFPSSLILHVPFFLTLHAPWCTCTSWEWWVCSNITVVCKKSCNVVQQEGNSLHNKRLHNFYYVWRTVKFSSNNDRSLAIVGR